MNPRRTGEPPNLRSLETRISNLTRDRGWPVRHTQRVVANTVVGQMLPSGVVKGGSAMTLRVGEVGSRFTPDLDVTRLKTVTLEDYLNELGEKLASGWAGFTGTVSQLEPAQPDGVPAEYVMLPFDLRLAYQSRHWLTVPFELGHDEIGSTAHCEKRLAPDIVEIFEELGLETPQPIPVLALDHQIAQKLHACTSVNPQTGGNNRAHDLVDLQILAREEQLDMTAIAQTAKRLFVARKSHSWPPTVVAHHNWATIYAEAAIGLNVIENVDEAVQWTNDFIAKTQG